MPALAVVTRQVTPRVTDAALCSTSGLYRALPLMSLGQRV
jgi:hypothetical protein